MSTRGLAEIVLIVDDVPKATAFYRDVVGLELEHEADEAWAWFWAGQPGEPQRLALHKGTLLFEGQSPHPEGERWGNVHYAFHVAAEDLEAAVDRVKAAGVDVYGPVHFDWMQADAYYFYDPDGNLLEFWSPRVSDGP